jgi:hypothetical protein
MALTTLETQALNDALHALRSAGNQVEQVLGGPVPPSDKRIDILQKNFAELSNYDRHYSTTRSALTTLLITVGLYVAGEPLKELWASQTCSWGDIGSAASYLLYRFPITILLFFLAFPVNLYFRRQTRACGWVERVIAREIALIAGLPDPPAIPTALQNLNPPISGYYFPQDFHRALRRIGRWPSLDEMTILLLFAQLEFLAILCCLMARQCGRPWYELLGFVAVPVVLAFILSRFRRT